MWFFILFYSISLDVFVNLATDCQKFFKTFFAQYSDIMLQLLLCRTEISQAKV